jgi:hypothetical protein
MIRGKAALHRMTGRTAEAAAAVTAPGIVGRIVAGRTTILP